MTQYKRCEARPEYSRGLSRVEVCRRLGVPLPTQQGEKPKEEVSEVVVVEDSTVEVQEEPAVENATVKEPVIETAEEVAEVETSEEETEEKETLKDKLSARKLKKELEKSEEKVAECEGVFLAVGLIPDNRLFAEYADLDGYGYVDAKEDCSTKTAGLFVAGDCRAKRVRQLTTATADGTVAALAAIEYLDGVTL